MIKEIKLLYIVLRSCVQPSWGRKFINENVVLVSGRPQTIHLPSGLFELTRDLVFSITFFLETVVAHKGLKSDGSSNPWYSRIIVRFSKVLVAGFVHDFTYKFAKWQSGAECTRLQADFVWWVVALYGEDKEGRANPWQAAVFYIGLRLGGWVTWHNYRIKDKTHLRLNAIARKLRLLS